MYYYALTLDKISLPGLPHHYEEFVRWFKKSYPAAEFEYQYEEGKQGRLHIHAMVKTPKRIYINRLRRACPVSDYHLNFEVVRSRIAWDMYIAKESKTESELLSKWYAEEYDFYNPDPPEDSEEYIEIPRIGTRI